jgi:hypothetical protein
MAVIKCKLEHDGRLKVLEVLAFEPCDTIQLDQEIQVSWDIQSNQPGNQPGNPVSFASKCLAVKTRFASGGRAVENVIPVPCPGN